MKNKKSSSGSSGHESDEEFSISSRVCSLCLNDKVSNGEEINPLISPNTRYRVPIYQRPYSWDYSDMFLNINGRVCLVMSCLWGLLGIVWIKWIYPPIEKLIRKIPEKLGHKLVVIISIFLVLDLALTISAGIRAKECAKGIPPHNAYERFLDKTFNEDYLYNMFNNHWSD